MPRLSLLLLAACAGEADAPLETSDPPALDACVAEVDCLVDGVNTVTVDGETRRVNVLLPDDPAGAPLLVAWHYLGGSPQELITWMQLRSLADAGWVVLAPKSRGLNGTEWDLFNTDAGSNEDFALFDHLVDASERTLGTDPAQVAITGFSAGGLFSTLLTMHRADVLAASAVFSGGTPTGSYSTPEADIPVMVTWGGPTDTYAGFDFDDASRKFSASLRRDGNPVLECEHSGGHVLPNNVTSALTTFLTGATLADRTPSTCVEAP